MTKGSRLNMPSRKLKVLLLTPPMTQLNTPYPATAYLTGFLRKYASNICDVVQADPAQELILRLFSKSGLNQIRDIASDQRLKSRKHASVKVFLAEFPRYERAIEPVLSFLQNKDSAFAYLLASEHFLPKGPRFEAIRQYEQSVPDGLYFAFGSLGIQDRAKYFASLFVDDVADVIREVIDPKFELSRYGEKLAASVPSFDPMYRELNSATSTLIEDMLDQITHELVHAHKPDVVGITVPFPGNVYGAFRIAKVCKSISCDIKLILGGGYVNTELRDLKEVRVFEYFDFVTLDDGERPLLAILDHLRDPSKDGGLLRTFVCRDGVVCLRTDPTLHDVPIKDSGTPTYDGLTLGGYLSLFEFLNPMHRIWSDGRWNKLTLAHGCYWKGCSFCDTTLDYIARFEDQNAVVIIDRMEKMIAETGQRGFHFVDEAAPPRTLFSLSRQLIDRGLGVSWWGNVRFEKTFTPELAGLMAEAGCVAISGGLEVASDRLLKLMNKGVSVEQVARVTRAFCEAGIMVHAYLMYGFPTQTEQETIDALERVRQLFQNGCIHSAYWHRFAATVHSPIGKNPGKYGIKTIALPADSFARNDLPFVDPTGTEHDILATGLNKALYNYMHGIGLDEDVRVWFDHVVPKPKVAKSFIAKALEWHGVTSRSNSRA
jgi:hypothetical protein